jgi:hypothetical protein
VSKQRPKRTRKDTNQADITRGLERCGYVVESIADTCRWADIMVWGYDWAYRDLLWRVFEIKTPDGRLTDTERSFQERHPGAVRTIRSAEDALAAFGRCE